MAYKFQDFFCTLMTTNKQKSKNLLIYASDSIYDDRQSLTFLTFISCGNLGDIEKRPGK